MCQGCKQGINDAYLPKIKIKSDILVVRVQYKLNANISRSKR